MSGLNTCEGHEREETEMNSLYAEVTRTILEQLEAGVTPWRKDWRAPRSWLLIYLNLMTIKFNCIYVLALGIVARIIWT